MSSDWDDPLGALRWHWGEAYTICTPEPSVWMAIRCDDHRKLRAETPLGLRDKIIRDYTARPVPRHMNGESLPVSPAGPHGGCAARPLAGPDGKRDH